MKYVVFARVGGTNFYWCVEFAGLKGIWVLDKKDATAFNDKEKAKLEILSMENSQRNWFYIRGKRKRKCALLIKEGK